MNLGKEVAGKFMTLFMVGVLSIFTTFVLMFLPGSPYGMGQPGAVWASLQIMSGLLLFWSGMVGAITSQITEVMAARYRQVILAIAAHIGMVLLFGWSALSTYEQFTKPVFVDPATASASVVGLGCLLAILAVVTWVLSLRYLLRAYRLYRPYRDLR